MKCIRCKKREAFPGQTHCPDCKSYKKYYSQGRYDVRVLKKVCTICGINPVEKFRNCVGCRQAKSESRAKLNKNGNDTSRAAL